MYEVSIQNRGPEGVRSYTQFRLTKKGSDDLMSRIERKLPFAGILDGLELAPDESVQKSTQNTPGRRTQKVNE